MSSILRQQSISRPDDKPAHLIADALSCVNSDRTVTDGDVSKLRRFVRIMRRMNEPKIPKTKTETLKALSEINDHETIRRVDKDFVFLARKEDLQFLSTLKDITLFCDGTFKYSPRNF